MDKNKLTSVKVNEDLFEEFKVMCVKTPSVPGDKYLV